jgi:hypothetical protein
MEDSLPERHLQRLDEDLPAVISYLWIFLMLDQLGTTPDQVAATLRANGVLGVRNTVRFLNPIVRYAQSKLTNVYGIDVIQGTVMRIVFADGSTRDEAVPDAVQQFLQAFHRGEYPDLEMPINAS